MAELLQSAEIQQQPTPEIQLLEVKVDTMSSGSSAAAAGGSSTSYTPDKLKALFGDLGKPTMRGVRKCPKCGTYNGTRGISCKNKTCNAIFKDRDSKKKGHSAEAVKIVTGSTVQVFSVRLRDRGPDYRGFVQLPLVQDLEGNPAETVDYNILSHAARCYVDTCCRNTDTQPCNHIKAAIGCSEEAVPLTLKNSVLNSLLVSSETKQAIWLLATETTGPLVQRVTKNIMAVKCKANPKQPLGFLHCAFFSTQRNRSEAEYKFQCSCKAFKLYNPRSGAVLAAGQTPLSRDDLLLRRCVHFYACICAFASDEKLATEFSYYITLDTGAQNCLSVNSSIDIPMLDGVVDNTDQVIAIYSSTGEETVEAEQVEIVIEDDLLAPPESKRQKKDDIAMAQASSALLTLQDGGSKKSPIKSNTTGKPGIIQKKLGNTAIDENCVQLDFVQWLASITERINQTMHYQFDGNPEPLVFHAPQIFFDCLQQRISSGQKKKRLPNSTTGFIRKDALPLGTFTKYTWHITNILHVKRIFDTAMMPLDVTRSFIENRDGTYDLYDKVIDGVEDTVRGKNQLPIRPFELRTFLKVGMMTPDQKEATPFIIEWIPDILPKSHIGELRIKFDFGHQRNGQIENRSTSLLHNPAGIELHTVHVQQL
ncbi:uncharacterized protein C2orf42-like [Tubulanus polymorphus]|uniref:uncharacterized protein C2orf42-like n=1 Tax=Tubulanus polymorphus TaxID=672921 RepID=UPI003DA648E5